MLKDSGGWKLLWIAVVAALFGIRPLAAAAFPERCPAVEAKRSLPLLAKLVPSGDTDLDGLSDVFEEKLVKKFFPNLWLSAIHDKEAFYGCITDDPYARVPYMVEPVWYSAGSLTGLACLYQGDCLLLQIGLAYDKDFGDDFFGGGHVGDSEFYYALLSRVSFDRGYVKKNAAGSTCTASLAKTDADCWWMMADWTSAHQGTIGDESYHAVLSPFLNTIGDSDAPIVYTASGKHSNYHLDAECDGSGGGPLGTDDCDPSYNVRDICFLKFQNIGNAVALGGNGQGDGYTRYIRYPLSSTSRYDMWSFDDFAGSSAYRPKFNLDGTYLWSLWYNCVFAGSATAKAVYCGRFDVQCRSSESCTCYDSCSPNQFLLACGNGVCSPGETCSSCPFDCGACPPVCGNHVCESGESCLSCSADCGSCPVGPVCGNGVCEGGETCQTSGGAGQCQQDCGCCQGWTPICFAAGTPVTLADGTTRPIEAIHEGDLVYAYDEPSGEIVAARVGRTFVHTDVHDRLIAINHQLMATGNHPFYVAGRAETVAAADLRLGDELLVLDSMSGSSEPVLRTMKVLALEQLPPARTVYNLEVEGQHNYFAGGVLVHNKTSTAGCQPSGGDPLR
jgi:hypothetical protein